LLIDSHAHLDSERYTHDRETMLGRAWEAGVGTVLAIGIGEQAAGMGPRSRNLPPVSMDSRIFRASTRAPASIRTTRTRSTTRFWPGSTACWLSPKSLPAERSGWTIFMKEPRARCSARVSSANWKSPRPASGLSSSIAGRKKAQTTPGRSLRDSGGPLAANRPGRRDALLRGRMGRGAAVVGPGFSGFIAAISPTRKLNLFGTWPPGCPWTVFWSRPTRPGWLRRPTAASATSRPGSCRRPWVWPSY